MKKFVNIAVVILGVFLIITSAYSGSKKKPIILYLFWAEGCPYCENEKHFLLTLKQKYSNLEIKDYEVLYNPSSRQLLQTISKAYNIKPSGVPVTFVGNRALVGFTEKIASQIEETIEYCNKNSCEDPLYKK